MEDAQAIDVYLLLFAGTLLLLLLAASVVLFMFLHRRRLARQQAAMEAMQQSLQQEMLRRNLEELEGERKRFAEDLHDDIGGKLSALRLHLAQLQKGYLDAAEAQLLLNRSKEIIDTVIVTVRRISHNLLPPALEMFGLANAVEELGSWVNTSSALTVQMDCQLEGIMLDQKKELALYRIIQELFSNTLRHSQAHSIYLSLLPDHKELQLVYRDDGQGLDPALAATSKGMGLRNIEERVKVMKGKIRYNYEGKGFECVIRFSAN